MKTIKVDEDGTVTMYGNKISIVKGAKEVYLFGDDYAVDWGNTTKKSKKSKKTDVTEDAQAVQTDQDEQEPTEVGNPDGQPEADTLESK